MFLRGTVRHVCWRSQSLRLSGVASYRNRALLTRAPPQDPIHHQFFRILSGRRPYSSASDAESENLNVSHARFLADSPVTAKWKGEEGNSAMTPGLEGSAQDFDTIAEGKGKLSPTSSHLFKLILPLEDLKPHDAHSGDPTEAPPPTVFLLHPSQPLTHVSRLITSSITSADPDISFRSASPSGQRIQWSGSTDLGDFVRDVARATEFTIHIAPAAGLQETTITVDVPTFADRTRFLRRRLDVITAELRAMEGLKRECDREARRGARRVAMGGFGLLVVYWGTVARLTFWDYGWDVMEPITYLSGLSTVICGYLWFLYQGREVSYSSVLDRSISTRRQALYKARGLDIEHWRDLVVESRGLRREIGQIARDYDQDWKRGRAEEKALDKEEDNESDDISREQVDSDDIPEPNMKSSEPGSHTGR